MNGFKTLLIELGISAQFIGGCSASLLLPRIVMVLGSLLLHVFTFPHLRRSHWKNNETDGGLNSVFRGLRAVLGCLSLSYRCRFYLVLCSLLSPYTCIASDDFFGAIELDPSVESESRVDKDDSASRLNENDASAATNTSARTPSRIRDKDVFRRISLDHKAFLRNKIKYGLDTPDTRFDFVRDDRGVSQFQTDFFSEFRGRRSEQLSWVLSGKVELDWVQWSGDNAEEKNKLDVKLNHEKFFLKDAFIDLSYSNGAWLRFGHQLFSWGESETLAITDILSPSDLREPGQAELRDIREQIPALLVSVPLPRASAGKQGGTGDVAKLSVVLTYKAGRNRLADREEEFFARVALGAKQKIRHQEPEKAWELVAKWTHQFNGGDMAVVLGEVNDNTSAFYGVERLGVEVGVTEPSHVQPGLSESQLVFKQARHQVLAVSGNKIWQGHWLLKGEFGGHFNKRRLAKRSRLGGLWRGHKEDQWRGMLGVEYSGWDDWHVSYEYNGIYHQGPEAEKNVMFLGDEKEDYSSHGQVLRLSYDSLNERLQNQWWILDLNGDEGFIYRWTMTYEWSDDVGFDAMLVAYDISDSGANLHPFRRHDSFNLGITYHF